MRNVFLNTRMNFFMLGVISEIVPSTLDYITNVEAREYTVDLANLNVDPVRVLLSFVKYVRNVEKKIIIICLFFLFSFSFQG